MRHLRERARRGVRARERAVLRSRVCSRVPVLHFDPRLHSAQTIGRVDALRKLVAGENTERGKPSRAAAGGDVVDAGAVAGVLEVFTLVRAE